MNTVAETAKRIAENIGRVIIGKDHVIELLLTALFAGGHVLLEDVPGTGKTTLAKALARSVSGSFSRVQFTPDLLPSDITGLRVFRQQEGTFRFEKGPVFTNILLADEINRATPRAQSALLECMEEKQVSDGGVTYPLEKPFLCIATQNPVETQGTFPLPEAQLDRFLMKLSMGYPSSEQCAAMLDRFTGSDPLASLAPAAEKVELAAMPALCAGCHVSADIKEYIVRLCEAARDPEKVRLGPSPRTMLALMHAAQALAMIRGREYVIPDDVKELAVPVLAHRVIPAGYSREDTGESIVRRVLDTVPVPTETKA